MDNFTSGITSVWDGVKDRVTGLFSGNAGDAAVAAADAAKESAPWDTMKIVRVSRTAAVGVATFALDMKDVFKPENKGKRWKAFTKALFKSSLMGGAIYATTSTGFGEHNSAAHDHVSANETTHTPETHDTAHTSDGAEAAADTMDFKHANETQLNRTFDADPRGVNAILNDGKFHTSAELHQMMEKNEFSDDQLKAIHGLALKDFDEKGHIIDPELKAYYENLARQSHVETHNTPNSAIPEKDGEEVIIENNEPAPVNPDQSKENNEIRDETYYQEQQDALKPKGQKGLEATINMAVKSDDIRADEAVDGYMAQQVEAERLTEQQGEQLGNYVKYELDAHDGDKNGTIEEENLSKRDVHNAMKDVKSTLNSMKDNADEIIIAENVTYTERTDLPENLPESHARDTHNAQFYRGMSEVTGEMVGHSENASTIMHEAVLNGRISEEQATAMNTRWAELREQGQNPERALKTMVKDYDNHAKFYEAQEPTVAETEVKDNELTDKTVNNATTKDDVITEDTGENLETTVGEAHLAKGNFAFGDVAYRFNNGELETSGSHAYTLWKDEKLLKTFGSEEYTENKDGSFTCGLSSASSLEEAKEAEAERLRGLVTKHSVYSDLQARIASGETLGEPETEFMARHEKELHASGLQSNAESNLVRLDNGNVIGPNANRTNETEIVAKDPDGHEASSDSNEQVPEKFREAANLENGESKKVYTKTGLERVVGKDVDGNMYAATVMRSGALLISVPETHPLHDIFASQPKSGSAEWVEKDRMMKGYIDHLRDPKANPFPEIQQTSDRNTGNVGSSLNKEPRGISNYIDAGFER